MNRKRKKEIVISYAILLSLLTGIYLSRNIILQAYLNTKIEEVEKKYDIIIAYQTLHFSGFNEFKIKNLTVVPINKDTLFWLDNLHITLDLPKLFTGKIAINRVNLSDMEAQLIKKDTITNYDCLFQKEKINKKRKDTEANFSQYTNKILNLLFKRFPQNGEINRFKIKLNRDSLQTEFQITKLSIRNGQFSSHLTMLEDKKHFHWKTTGMLNKNKQTLAVKLYSSDSIEILPYITSRYSAQFSFDTLAFQLAKSENPSYTTLTGVAKITGLEVFHTTFSTEKVYLEYGKINYHIRIGSNKIELDSTSIFQFNYLQFHPYICATKQNKWHFIVAINKPWFPSDQLFASLPQGLFHHLEGIGTRGNLAYHFLLDVDMEHPDSLQFESELKERNFRILNYGKTNLSKMKEEFIHTVYEQGNPVKTFSLGHSNPNFRPLDSISPYLQMAVLQAEDGAFYQHQGFLPDAIREALVQDLKEKRFARGGSTLTMQLVKNVFLNKNKTVARKLEEALITWIIETAHLTSKPRMFEVYLNLIEWGPRIYGATEASYYYFNKEPSRLTLNEAIFLASIIPKPKHFRNSFTSRMQLKENMQDYYQTIARRLQAKELLPAAQINLIRPDIRLTGKALKDLGNQQDSAGEPNWKSDKR